jgi:hypothetical protein
MKLRMALIVSLCGVCALAFAQTPSPAKSKSQPYSPPRLADGKPDLNGIWEVRAKVDADLEGKIGGRNIIVDPADGKIPYKPEARAQKKDPKRATSDPISKCWMPGVPRLMYVPYPFQIVQSPNQPVIPILSQYVHTIRNIHMQGDHLDGLENWLGDSRGHWEGDTLVVDVTNFNDQTWFDAAGNYHSGDLHVTERITYEATISDPQVLTKPFKISVPLTLHTEKNFQILEYECYAMKEGPTFTVGDKK